MSRTLLLDEMGECEKDLKAFKRAYDCIHLRVSEVKDEGRFLKLVDWSGTGAVMNSLDLAIHALERTFEEMEDILARMDTGEIKDLDED